MKVVIFAGGMGTRISEESHLRPKPMVEIGGKPILWHIMKIYSSYGFNDFIICCGYKGYVIKEYFNNYYLHMSDITYDFRSGDMRTIHSNTAEPWRVTLVDTGLYTPTGGRLKQVEKYIGKDETFMLTYGDGVSDVDLAALLKYHNEHGKLATLTAVPSFGKYGMLDLGDDSNVRKFAEKSKDDVSWINGGFFVLNKEVFNYLGNGDTYFESAPLEKIAAEGNLMAYRHTGFWQSMDTMSEKETLERYWQEGNAAWKKW